MKAAPFAYERPADIKGVFAAMASGGTSKLMAGGQSLGPMLNLRLVQPDLVIDITGLPDLKQADRDDGSVVIGACVTHADIEDGRVPDVTRGAMAAIAADIAYRAVRNRGTIGGSLTHADPSADWPSVLAAFGASVIVRRESGTREIPVEDFVTGALECALEAGEIVESVRVPARTRTAQWGFVKNCRKPGEYAHAIGAALIDPDAGTARVVVGAVDAAPITLADPAALFGGRIDGEFKSRFDHRVADGVLAKAGLEDAVDRHIHVTVLRRAIMRAAP